MKKGKELFKLSDAQFGFLMTVPALIFLFLILFYPMINLIHLSFKWYSLITPERGSPYVGLEHFARAFTDPLFWEALYHTLYFTALTLTVELLIGLGIAWLMTRMRRSLNVTRGLVLLPWMTPWVAVAAMWAWIFNYEYGIANYVLLRLGLIHKPIFWLGDARFALNTLVGISIWRQFPIATIFLIAGYQGIPAELYEAARIDGASAWQEFRYIALPLVKPVILLVLILRTTFALRIFDLIYVTTEGGPAGSTEVFSTYIYEAAFVGWNLGFASALSLILLVITLSISFIYIKFLPKPGQV